MARVFDNPNNIPGSLIQSRIREYDRNGVGTAYEVENFEFPGIITHYVAIESIATDEQIISLLSTPVTTDEQTEFQKTLDTLQTIANLTNPTNAQIVQAINYLARTLRIVIRHFIRYY